MEALIDAMDKEKDERFQKSWPKLDKGSKLNRILIFILEEKERNTLNETQTKQLKKLLFLQCEKGTLNKASDVEYSDETYQIVSIKNLEYPVYRIFQNSLLNYPVNIKLEDLKRITVCSRQNFPI